MATPWTPEWISLTIPGVLTTGYRRHAPESAYGVGPFFGITFLFTLGVRWDIPNAKRTATYHSEDSTLEVSQPIVWNVSRQRRANELKLILI
jgi:hypothetical protein